MNRQQRRAAAKKATKNKSELRGHSRALFVLAWCAHKAGMIDELSDETRRLAKVMAEHTDWYHLWDAADDELVGDSDITTSKGVSPFGQVATEATGEGLIEENPEGRLTYQHLRSEDWTHEDARAEICRAFLGFLFWANKAVTEGKPHTFYPLADLDHVFKRIRLGESAEEIFEDDG